MTRCTRRPPRWPPMARCLRGCSHEARPHDGRRRGGGMALAKALGWSAAQSAVRMAVGFATIKVTAVYLGPAGLAVVGQLNNFLSMSTAATVNGVQTGLTKMTAER